MQYQILLPFSVALLPLLKKHKGSRSILPIPKGSMVEELIRYRGVFKTSVAGAAPEFKKIYEDFKSVMPENLFMALTYLSPQSVNIGILRSYGRLSIGDYGLSTILFSWYPKSFQELIHELKFGKDTFKGIPIDFPIPDFPNVKDIIIEYQDVGDQSLLTKRSFDYVDLSQISDVYLKTIDPKQLNAVINNIPNANLLPNLQSMKIVVSSTAYLDFSSLKKLLPFYQVHKNAFKRISISVSGIGDWGLGGSNPKIIIKGKRGDIFRYFQRKGIDPRILMEFMQRFNFAEDSELRKF